MFKFSNEKITFEWNELTDAGMGRKLSYEGKELNFISENYFEIPDFSSIPIPHRERRQLSFNPHRGDIIFSPKAKELFEDVLNATKQIYENKEYQQKYNNTELRRVGSLLCATLFESLAGFWEQMLLSQNLDRLGISFWRQILDIVNNWQENNDGIFIHKGTPYYFLAENYFLVGDLDSAFTYLHNALKIDEQTWQWEREGHVGAYSLSKMIDDPYTQMNYLTKNHRKQLDGFIKKFNSEFGDLTLEEVSNKFLKNEEKYHIISYFFVFTFHSIIHHMHNLKLETPENYFSKVRSLDMIFNLCLIIDDILKNRFLDSFPDDKKYISNGIHEYCKKFNFDYMTFQKNWKQERKFDRTNPNKTIQLLLQKEEKYEGNSLPKEVFTLMLAHYCRNIGAHSLNENSFFVTQYQKIIDELMMGLFLAIKSID